MKNNSICLFKGYSDTLPAESNLQEIANLIKEDALIRDHTEKHRYYLANGQKNTAAHEKASCPCFAVAVRFEGGKQKANIAGWTELALVDIDHVPDDKLPKLLKLIHADVHTLLAYTTISGNGIRIISPINGLTDHHEKNLKLYPIAFEQTNNYYARLLDCECDLKCKNITRLSGLAHDPDVFFNPDATPFTIEKKSEKRNASAANSKPNRQLRKAVTTATQELKAEGLKYAEHHQ